MNIQLINLDRSPERLAFMGEQLTALGCRFTRLQAVDARKFAPCDIEAFRDSTKPQRRLHEWAPEQIAIFLSHQKAWRAIAESADHFGCILEDDVHIAPSCGRLLLGNDWLPHSIGVLRLETTMQSMKLKRAPIFQIDGMSAYKLTSESWGAAAYIIDREIARWLVSFPPTMYQPVDWFLFHPLAVVPRKIDIIQLDPAPCVQDQYHPNRSSRLDFERVTRLPNLAAGYLRNFISPVARAVRRRRVIPFR